MTKEELEKNLNWFEHVDTLAGDNAYSQDDIADVWSQICSKASNLEDSLGDYDIDNAINGDNGTIEDGEELQDLMLNQAEQTSDAWVTHQYIVGAAKINDMDEVYVVYDDPTDVEEVTNDTLSDVLDDIIYDLKHDLKKVTA